MWSKCVVVLAGLAAARAIPREEDSNEGRGQRIYTGFNEPFEGPVPQEKPYGLYDGQISTLVVSSTGLSEIHLKPTGEEDSFGDPIQLVSTVFKGRVSYLRGKLKKGSVNPPPKRRDIEGIDSIMSNRPQAGTGGDITTKTSVDVISNPDDEFEVIDSMDFENLVFKLGDSGVKNIKYGQRCNEKLPGCESTLEFEASIRRVTMREDSPDKLIYKGFVTDVNLERSGSTIKEAIVDTNDELEDIDTRLSTVFDFHGKVKNIRIRLRGSGASGSYRTAASSSIEEALINLTVKDVNEVASQGNNDDNDDGEEVIHDDKEGLSAEDDVINLVIKDIKELSL